MCTKCIITPIIFLIILALGLFFIWNEAFAISTLDSIGKHDPAIFTAALANRASEQDMFRAFVLLLGIVTLGGIGFFIKTKLKPSA